MRNGSNTKNSICSICRMAYKIGKLEPENSLLKQLQAQHKGQANHTARTYASALTGNLIRSTPRNIQHSNINEPFKTPPNTNKIETLVRISNINDPKETIKKLKEDLINKDTEGGFKAVRTIKSGAVIIESHNNTQHKKLKEALAKKTDVTLKHLQKTEPMFMVTGIEGGYKEK